MVLIVILLMCFLQSVESNECKQSEIIVKRLGEKLELNFVLSDIKEEYNQDISEYDSLKDIEDLKKDSLIHFRNKPDPDQRQVIFMNGQQTYLLDRNRTMIVQINDTIVVNITRLQKEDAGLYFINFRSQFLGHKGLIITGKPNIIAHFPSHPVLKEDDNTTTIPLECQVVSTSVGICRPFYNSMYIIWYKNGMRMTNRDLKPRINVTIDYNGGNFTCFATDYPPCNETLHYNLNEECNDVVESENLMVRPYYSPRDVKLETDEGEKSFVEDEDFEMRCSAKCHPECSITWQKNSQDLHTSDLITITTNTNTSELKLANLSRPDEGLYSCLVKNDYGNALREIVLSVKGTDETALMSENRSLIIAVSVVIVIVIADIVVVIIFIMYRQYTRERKNYEMINKRNSDHDFPRNHSQSEEDDGIFETMNLYGGAPLQREQNSRNGVHKKIPENLQYVQLDLHTPANNKIHGLKQYTVVYSQIDFTKKAPPMPKDIEMDSDDEEWS